MKEGEDKCGCPVRKRAPDPPVDIPFEHIPENIPKLKMCIVDLYRSSAFNQCTHQVLPVVVSSPPLNLLVDPSIKP